MFAGGYCGGMGLGGWLLMVGFWLGVVALAVWAVTRLFPSGPRRPDPRDVLDRRLAAGEIDPEAYREARDELTGAAHR